MNRKSTILLAFIALLLCFPTGQIFSQKPLTFDDVFGRMLIRQRGGGYVSWMKDGERYSNIEFNRETRGASIVAVRASDEKREVLVPESMSQI